MSDSPHDGAMLCLGTSSSGSITCLHNTETKTQETRVLLNIACVTITLMLALVPLCWIKQQQNRPVSNRT